MPSVSKPQATLMAFAAHSPAFAKKRGIPIGVAREFNQADQASGILKKAGGGAASMIGHALSGTPLGDADSLIRKAQDRFATFAEGGAVKKPPGPSAKERKEIRGLIERGKTNAVAALRDTRDALIQAQPSMPGDASASLEKLSARLAMEDGGEVEADALSTDPAVMYQEYADLMATVDDPRIDDELRAQMVDRMAEIEDALDAVGINVGGDEE